MILKPLALIGFPGSGKSAVGSYAARELGLPFTDLTDAVPELPEGVSMAGKTALSTLYLSKAAAAGGIVASSSTDIMMPKNRQILKKYFVTVFLDAPFDALYPRITTSGKEIAYRYGSTELKRLYEMRKEQYRNAADFTVDCSASIEDVASEVAEIALREGCADIDSIVF